ncbi:DUF72 domain-containing protein [Streptomyces griseorubiginosus]|uniref:DUF72 domain-containing protein n=1 Tax=Streptomyces griseorubiginosus TaxID=67304 RepID=UPI002E816942|nr:DUF72 domain-containing protein [Streptomyces griseorubiginosus]WUB45926.1 DUF72 domain-containing protein [Streptomyces griseorubiginosus]WUB54447.1 DUF72 domain-containing protein [Streptomyces griseorubiginosus]
MTNILVGTCSWTDPALVRSGWYPSGWRDAERRLRFYAGRFPVVEVDGSFYALPSERNSRLWVERTPAEFVFDVKAYAPLTGHPAKQAAFADVPLDEVWERFAAGIEPLREAGRLGGVLFQFPPWLRPGARAEQFLEETAERTAGWPVHVEFRHPSWWEERQRDLTCALLHKYGFAAVAVDMRQGLPASLPPVTPVTANRLAVVRFHGRSSSWGRGSKEDRFRYDYSRAELAEWVPRLRALAERVDQVHVLFNNCCAAAAVHAAETMDDLLSPRSAPTSSR